GRLGAPPQRGQVGSGQGPRAALPGSNQGGRPGAPGAPGGARGQQGPASGQQGRPAPAGAGAGGFGQGAPQGLQAAGPGSAQGFGDGSRQGGGFGDASGARQGGAGARQGGFGDSGPAAAPAQQQPTGGKTGRRRPQLPGRGGARAELPGADQQPRVPSWSDENAQPPVPRTSLDAPRGHEEPDSTSRMPRIDDRQGPGSTSEFARPDFDAPRPGAGAPQNSGQNTGQFVRPDVFNASHQAPAQQGPSSTGQFAVPGYGNGQDPSSTGQFARPGYGNAQDPSSTGQFAVPGYGNGQGPSSTGQFAVPGYGNGQDPSSTGQFERPGAPQRPQPQQRAPRQQEPEALPPAPGPGDGRTPLYDTLETNWFHGQANGAHSQGVQNNGSQGSPQVAQQPQAPSAPQRPAAAPAAASWRTSPNDDLVRQAERVRQPSAGGVTTSGLPRRVPRANLVAGTAQQQSHQSGPQVSRAPDDVRGRLTNLRRGIQQGRQAGTGQTGSFPSPTHQQER
ncbi:hypothetical protein ABZ446_37355, partial [Streptomyces sp. NPDC005813]